MSPFTVSGWIIIIHKPENSWNSWPFGNDSPIPLTIHIIPVTENELSWWNSSKLVLFINRGIQFVLLLDKHINPPYYLIVSPFFSPNVAQNSAIYKSYPLVI